MQQSTRMAFSDFRITDLSKDQRAALERLTVDMMSGSDPSGFEWESLLSPRRLADGMYFEFADVGGFTALLPIEVLNWEDVWIRAALPTADKSALLILLEDRSEVPAGASDNELFDYNFRFVAIAPRFLETELYIVTIYHSVPGFSGFAVDEG